MNKKCSLIALLLLLSTTIGNAAIPYFSFRSQSVNAVREIAGWQNHINIYDKEEIYASLTLTPEYTRSFRPGSIASCLFSPYMDCSGTCPTITISGSRTSGTNSSINVNRGSCDWLADYFGLPTDFKSTLNFKPYISNFNLDLNLFVGLDAATPGLYFRIHAPLTYTKWALGFCETKITPGTNAHLIGYFSDKAIERANLLNNATEFFSCQKAPTLSADTIGTMKFDPLKYSKFPTCFLSKVRLSDIEAEFGWNFVLDEDYHFGIGLRGSAPTGNKPEGCWLFEPVVGSGGHWKLGASVGGHCCLWRSEDEESSFGFWVHANIQHLFKACQTRSFDLCGKPNSRYMLAQKLGTTRLSPQLTGDSNADVEFQNHFSPVANLSTFAVKTDVAAEGDIVAKFAYTNECFEWDFGYEFWGRSCEKICSTCTPAGLDGKTWALKGDAYVVGFVNTGTTGYRPVRLAATENCATILKGTNVADSDTEPTNGSIDNPQDAVSAAGDVLNLNSASGVQTHSSKAVIFLDKDKLGLTNASTKGTAHKMFTNFSHTWLDNEDWTPFLGVGASVEFTPDDCCLSNCTSLCTTSSCSNSCTTSCSSSCGTSCCSTSCDTSCCNAGCTADCCTNCSASQWAVWVKGGVSFN